MVCACTCNGITITDVDAEAQRMHYLMDGDAYVT